MTSSPAAESYIRGVLDSTAIQSYGRGHIHVGEVMNEIGDDRGDVGIPATALLDAHAHFVDDAVARARLNVLTTLPGTRVFDLDTNTAVAVADVVRFAGDDLARAHVAWAALHHSAVLFTTEPEKAWPAMNAEQIIAIPTEDA